MEYNVRIKKKVARGLKNLPQDVQKLLFLLIEDLKSYGPIQKAGKTFLLWARRTNIIAILHIAMSRVGLVIREK
jgi:hypothetical protein